MIHNLKNVERGKFNLPIRYAISRFKLKIFTPSHLRAIATPKK
jgi:hypothetical protein